MSAMARAPRRSSRRTQPPSYLTDYSTEYIGYSYQACESDEPREDPWLLDECQVAPPCSQQADVQPAAAQCPPAELEKMQNNIAELHKTMMQFGASVQALAHWLDDTSSPHSRSTASAEASTHGSPTGRDLPPDDASRQDSSCQVDKSSIEEMCHCLQSPEFQASHGLSSPPSGGRMSLSPPPASTTPSLEPLHLQPSHQLSGFLSAAQDGESPVSAQDWDHWGLNPFPHHLAASGVARPLRLTQPGVPPVLIPPQSNMSSGQRDSAMHRGGSDLSSYAAQPMDLSCLQPQNQRASHPPVQTVPAASGIPSYSPYQATGAPSFSQTATGVVRAQLLRPRAHAFPPYAFNGLHPSQLMTASPGLLTHSPLVRAPAAIRADVSRRTPIYPAAAHRPRHMGAPYPRPVRDDPQHLAALRSLHSQKEAAQFKERVLLEHLQLDSARRRALSYSMMKNMT